MSSKQQHKQASRIPAKTCRRGISDIGLVCDSYKIGFFSKESLVTTNNDRNAQELETFSTLLLQKLS